MQSPEARPTIVAAAVALSVIGAFGILAAPILAQALGAELGLGPGQIGQIVSAEIFGGALASLLATTWIRSVNWRVAAGGAVVMLVALNLLSSVQDDVTVLTALRFAAGFLGEGTAFAVAIGIINALPNPERNFAFSIAAQVTVGILTLVVLPPLAKSFGLAGVLVPLAGLAALALALVPFVMPRAPIRDVGAGAAAGTSVTALVALGVLLLWCTGLGSIWTFLIAIGEAGGLDPARAGQAIAISTACGVAGALAASWLAGRGGRLLPVAIALGVQVAAILVLQGEMSFLRFAATAAVFQAFWNFTGPYLMGNVAANDPTGRVSVLIPAAQTGGFALGPFVAGQLMTEGSLIAANYVGVAGCALALLLFLPTVVRAGRPAPTGA